MRLTILCALTAAFLCVSAQASAQNGSAQRALFLTPMGEPFRADESDQHGIDLWFSAADADRDGKMSRAEYMTEAMAFFAQLDTNHDASATSAESNALWSRRAPEVIGRLDRAPPIISPRPAPRGDSQHHSDSNRSGIDYNEDGSARRRRAPAEEPQIPQGAARYGLLNDIEPVMTCDTDFNRRVTRAEFEACADQRFTRIDLNGDGFFTPEEGGAPPVAPAPATPAAN